MKPSNQVMVFERRGGRVVEGTPLLREQWDKTHSRVRIPLSPPLNKKARPDRAFLFMRMGGGENRRRKQGFEKFSRMLNFVARRAGASRMLAQQSLSLLRLV